MTFSFLWVPELSPASATSFSLLTTPTLNWLNRGRSCTPGLTSSQAGRRLTTASYSSNCRLRTFSQSKSKLKSKSKLLYDWRFNANRFVLASSPLRPTTPTEPLMAAGPRYIAWLGPHGKHGFNYCIFCRCRRNNISTQLFPNNGCCTVTCLHSCFLTMCLHVTLFKPRIRHNKIKNHVNKLWSSLWQSVKLWRRIRKWS
jgi:hypothetical protein